MFCSRSSNINDNEIIRVDELTAIKLNDLLKHMMKNYTPCEIKEALHINNIITYCEVISDAENNYVVGKSVQ